MIGLEIPIRNPEILKNKEELVRRYIEELILTPREPWMLAHLKKESHELYSLAEYACGAIDQFKGNIDEELFVYDIKNIIWITPNTLSVIVEFFYE